MRPPTTKKGVEKMSAIKGDFTGFTFNGVHSSELGLTRVSDNSRYTENLYPTIQDKTVQIPGADGTYYFGSFYTQRPINISVAFDDVSEEQLQNIKRIFGDKKIHDLIFDETPYKVYRVKSTGTPNLKYVCFNKGPDTFDRDYEDNLKYETKEQLYGVGAVSPFGRVYKGEGQLNFVCYSPFARSRYKYINNYTIQNVPEWGPMDNPSANNVHYNLYDWVDSAGLKRNDAGKVVYDTSYVIDKVQSTGVLVYNPGNFPVSFNLIFDFTGSISNCLLSSAQNQDFESHFLRFENLTLKTDDDAIRINGSLNLIEGMKRNYKEVEDSIGKNPTAEGWYELDDETYVLSSDTFADQTKTYYRLFFTQSGTIYNDCITQGDFFKIPITSDLIFLPITFENDAPNNFKGYIEYDYLYY